MPAERSNFSITDTDLVYNPEFDIFRPEHLVHVRRLATIDEDLRVGLLSPAARARRQGREVRNPGIWFVNDNLMMKFLKHERATREVNIGRLREHFGMFGDFDEGHAIGYVVDREDASRLGEGEPYFGIDDMVPPHDFKGIVVPLLPMMLPSLQRPQNKVAVQKVITSVTAATAEGNIMHPFFIVDQFGRQIMKIS